MKTEIKLSVRLLLVLILLCNSAIKHINKCYKLVNRIETCIGEPVLVHEIMFIKAVREYSFNFKYFNSIIFEISLQKNKV